MVLENGTGGYYRPRGASAATLSLIGRIDELYLQYPFYGSQHGILALERAVGRHRVRRLTTTRPNQVWCGGRHLIPVLS